MESITKKHVEELRARKAMESSAKKWDFMMMCIKMFLLVCVLSMNIL